MNRRVHSLSFTDHFQIQPCLTATAFQVDSAGDDAAKIFYFPNLRLQLLIGTQELSRLLGGIAVTKLVKHEADYPANEKNDQKT